MTHAHPSGPPAYRLPAYKQWSAREIAWLFLILAQAAIPLVRDHCCVGALRLRDLSLQNGVLCDHRRSHRNAGLFARLIAGPPNTHTHDPYCATFGIGKAVIESLLRELSAREDLRLVILDCFEDTYLEVRQQSRQAIPTVDVLNSAIEEMIRTCAPTLQAKRRGPHAVT